MPSFKKETAGEATIWTLRNTKGNELKVSTLGAHVVGMRFRDKNFTNRQLFKDAGSVLVDGGSDFAKILWQAEETLEGLKLLRAGRRQVRNRHLQHFQRQRDQHQVRDERHCRHFNRIDFRLARFGLQSRSKGRGLGENRRRKNLSRHRDCRSRNGIGHVRLRSRLPD